eukprot:CAMPEP_0180662952 /NCGR_PEP_ID=MMETSP1037_2-20121125/59676_1 /TAXON_ID=632150 /ORGANISM="Azadinium spinosum, Strain 3D9" /LENGTH=42 /DNA_ID= /DNA_START= /DNA_END= /DNA_ORIENTATION=
MPMIGQVSQTEGSARKSLCPDSLTSDGDSDAMEVDPGANFVN